jgi:hypothetical protein
VSPAERVFEYTRIAERFHDQREFHKAAYWSEQARRVREQIECAKAVTP